ASLGPQGVPQNAGDTQLGHPGSPSLECPGARAARVLFGAPTGLDLARISRRAQGLAHVELRPPSPTSSLRELALKVGAQRAYAPNPQITASAASASAERRRSGSRA